MARLFPVSAIPASLMVSCASSSGLPVYWAASSRLCGWPAAAVVVLPHCLCFLLIRNQSKASATRKDTATPMAMPAMVPVDKSWSWCEVAAEEPVMGPEIGMLAAEELVMSVATCTLVAEELLVGVEIDTLGAGAILCSFEAPQTTSMLGAGAIGVLAAGIWTWPSLIVLRKRAAYLGFSQLLTWYFLATRQECHESNIEGK